MTKARTAPAADAYSRLGLTPAASPTDVKRAYRRLALRFHPDRPGSGSIEAFLDVKAAYEWIAAHRSLAEPGDRRPGSAPRTSAARPVRRASKPARPANPPAARSSWPGGRWYWEGMRERAAQTVILRLFAVDRAAR